MDVSIPFEPGTWKSFKNILSSLFIEPTSNPTTILYTLLLLTNLPSIFIFHNQFVAWQEIVTRFLSQNTYFKLFFTSYTSWGEGEPNNAGGNENCVHLYMKKDKNWNDKKCSQSYAHVCQKVCRETNSLSVAVNLSTIHHINNNILWLVLLLSFFSLNTLKVGMVSSSTQQVIYVLNIWWSEETFREPKYHHEFNKWHALDTFRAPDEIEIWENELFRHMKSE